MANFVIIRSMKVNRSILPSGRIGLAVSGGSDSVALAFLLTKGGKKKNVAKRFVILHVDHGLRKESKEEYRFVRTLAKRLGIPFKGTHAKVVKHTGESLEMAARLLGLPPVDFSQETAIGALGLYISRGSIGDFQPMNINFGIISPLTRRVKGKRNKNAEISARSLAQIDELVKGDLWNAYSH